ncbi:class I SAM-dependent methyltransferase [Pseudonocardia sp. CA-107938]|uniref:class I SAM-dependent methyltransferase n=1 Tax=Pseudonocardia sp. CA-107938 TaxID=3240021 RepID=UPI003D8DEEA2
MTTDWYREVLQRLPDGARVLDVGIGTGAALARSAALVEEKRLEIVGLDIDADYLDRCRRNVAEAGLTDRVHPVLASVYDHTGGPYDAVYFSASLMLLPDPVAAIRHVGTLLAPGGRVFATQTFNHRRSKFVEWAKPVLRHLTTIEFGQVTYEPEFRAAFAEAGAELLELSIINGSRLFSHRLAVAVPGAAPRAA